jgi:hypothetical protein
MVFQMVAWPCEKIFFLPAVPKSDLSEVGKAMSQRVGGTCESIFCLLAGHRRDLSEVEKAMFVVVDEHR